MTNEFFEKSLSILLDISNNLRPVHFWQDYAFWSVVILAITLFWLIRYTRATEKMKEEIVLQTNLQQMPIVMLFIRDVRDYMDNTADYIQQQKYRGKYKDFLIRIRTESDNSNYYLGLRNVGNGAAFNVEVKSNIFQVSKYQSRFLAPHKDEQPFAITEEEDKKIESWNKFKDSIFEISCKDISNMQHLFKYKILGIEDKKIDFIEHN